MTFATTTTGTRVFRPRFWIEIQGIEPVFVEATISPASVVSSRTQHKVIMPGGLQVGESRLDLEQLAEQGASLTVRLRDTSARVLRALFASRTRRQMYLTSSVASTTAMSGSGTLNVSSTTGMSSTGTVYVGAETFTYGGKTSTTLTSVTRSLYSSRAQLHTGGTNDGASVWLVPPNWVGRRVTLKACYVQDDGTTSSGESATIGTFRLEQHPRYVGGDEWELECGGLHEAYASARCYVGQREAKPKADGTGYEVSTSGVIDLDASEAFLFAIGGVQTFVRVTYAAESGRVELAPLLAADGSTSITVSLAPGPLPPPVFVNGRRQFGVRTVTVESLQHVAYLTGDPTAIVLMLLLSQLGDGTNGVYDSLPGAARTGFGLEEWRFGAGLLLADVNVSSFQRLSGQGPKWTVLIDEEMTVADLLVEFCRALRAYWYVDSSGQLSVAKLREKSTASAASTSLTALTDARLVEDEQEALEPEQARPTHSAHVLANWDPLSKKYLFEQTVVDVELQALFPEASNVLEVESRFLSVDASSFASGEASAMKRANPMQPNDLLVLLRRAMVSSSLTHLFLRHVFSWQAAGVNVGDVVRVTNARVPDLRGTTIGATTGEGDCLVVGKQLNVDQATVALRLLLLDKGYRLAPVGIVSSWDAGTKTATLNGSDATGSNPGNNFAAGWSVAMFDVSATPHTEAALTIASVTATSITFTGAPAFTPAAGDLILPKPTDGTGLSSSGYTEEDFTYQVPDAGTLGVSGVTDSRWG
jgi:hypothetical protein